MPKAMNSRSAQATQSQSHARLSRQAEHEEGQFRSLFGRRVREARKQRGLTTRGLAELAGVTQAFISQIELGQVAPSLSTMFRVAGALGITLGELFYEQESASEEVLDPEGWQVYTVDEKLEEALLGLDRDKRIQCHWSRFAPGYETAGESLSWGAKVQVIFVFVLRGRIELSLNGQKHVLRKHSSIMFDGRTPHRWANRTRQPAEMVGITAPGAI
jgi:transcriptional regulator with XRE-family HTH domain